MVCSIQPVVLCGGSGTRLWPLSRAQYPKQLLSLTGGHTLLQTTVLRLQGEPGVGAPLVIGGAEYRFVLRDQLAEVGVVPQSMLLEPCGRNTAPALTLAAMVAHADGQDPVLVVMPADHLIVDTVAFRVAVRSAVQLAEAGRIVTFGIAPTAPETGYGYIEMGAALAQGGYALARFVEKPDEATAERYIQQGCYVWNSGIFVVKASHWLQQMAKHQAAMLAVCERIRTCEGGLKQDGIFQHIQPELFSTCPADSIDYAVMEKLCADEAAVVPFAGGWSDIGAWGAVWAALAQDASGNAVVGDGLLVDSHNTLVYASSRLVSCVGVRDLVVIETPDAVLVADRQQSQHVRHIVQQLTQAGREEVAQHRKVHRPWGCYDSIDHGERFQVKHIHVKPGQSLSLQMHHHRAEHWIVVKGTARVTRGEDCFLVGENESTYIPVGVKHRLENPGCVPLEMIEVQSGSYLGEDDIVRFDDVYGRG